MSRTRIVLLAGFILATLLFFTLGNFSLKNPTFIEARETEAIDSLLTPDQAVEYAKIDSEDKMAHYTFWKDKNTGLAGLFLQQGAESIEDQTKAAELLIAAAEAEAAKPESPATTAKKDYYSHSATFALEKIIAEDSSNYKAKRTLGFLLIRNLKTPMKGILMLRDVAEENPQDVEVQMILGSMSIMSGQYDKAVGRFEEVLKYEPERMDAKFQLAEAYVAVNKPAKAKAVLQALSKKDPSNVDVYYKLAEICLSQEDSDGAISILRGAIDNFRGQDNQIEEFKMNIQQIIESRI